MGRQSLDRAGRVWPRADLRAGDADRRRVVAELQRHFVDGRLSSEELGERVDQALAARTFGELAQPLADLPALGDETQYSTPSDAPSSAWQEALAYAPTLLTLLGVVLIAMVLLVPLTFGGRMGFMPFWPLLIWGFFFIGRPPRGGRGGPINGPRSRAR